MSGYIGTQPVPQATQTRDAFTATSNQTSFATSGYTPNFLDVFLNGVKMAAADYTASNGSDVVLASGAATGDILEVVAYTTFDTANVTGAANFTVTGSFTSQGIDDNANATAITIDSSENVLVGKTSADFGVTVGAELNANDTAYFTRSGGGTLTLNRLSSDGDIALFRKDGATVGSIGVQSTDQLYIGTPDGNGVGIVFDGDNRKIDPTNGSGSNLDAAVDLGNGSHRFKDLYLSGGVDFGGAVNAGGVVSSSNKLEDFETGDWLPVVKTSGTGSTLTYNTDYIFRSAHSNTDTSRITYTKIGNRVFISFAFWSKLSASHRFNISLPFAYLNSAYQVSGAASFYGVNTAAGIGFLGYGGSTFDTFSVSETGTHSSVSLSVGSEVYYNFSYQAV